MTNEELTLWLEENHRLVRSKANSWAKSYNHLNLTYDDAYSLALEAVVRASKKFDASKGYKFSTYCGMAIDNQFRVLNRQYNNKYKYITYEVSLNNITSDADGKETENIHLIEDVNTNIENEIANKDFVEFIKAITESKVKYGGQIFELMLEGYRQREIARELNISSSYCFKLYHKVIDVVKEEIKKTKHST